LVVDRLPVDAVLVVPVQLVADVIARGRNGRALRFTRRLAALGLRIRAAHYPTDVGCTEQAAEVLRNVHAGRLRIRAVGAPAHRRQDHSHRHTQLDTALDRTLGARCGGGHRPILTAPGQPASAWETARRGGSTRLWPY